MSDTVTISRASYEQYFRASRILTRITLKLALAGKSDLLKDAEREVEELEDEYQHRAAS
tara:strand:- start:1086 stop:1262 length:177 start_codon:yes stop_codon:yes gene_type:complete